MSVSANVGVANHPDQEMKSFSFAAAAVIIETEVGNQIC
jgi:hypothetical protein